MKVILHHFLIMFIVVYFTRIGVTQEFTEHLIASNYNSWSAIAIDMDNDDDMDIVGSSRFGNKVSWWENNGSGSFSEHIISTTAWYAMGVSAADIDNDDDIDVVCAAQEADAVFWWKNDGNQNFTQLNAADIISPSFIYLADVDLDEDQDILVAACEDGSNKIVWLENIGLFGFNFHIIKENWDHANSISAADIDSDSDIDVLATASFSTAPQNGEISWFKNDGNQNFTEHNIINNYGRPSCAISCDIDNDGDTDVIASVCSLHRIVWFENDGMQNFTNNIVNSNFIRPHNITAADMDNDGDQDIIGTAINLNQIAWFENNGNDFTKHIVSNSFGGATCVDAVDMDGDGDQDILGAAQFDNQIKWWESDLITGFDVESDYNPQKHSGLNNYPNPFTFSTIITYKVHENSKVVLKIFDSKANEITTLVCEFQPHGNKTIVWDGTNSNNENVSSGIYYCVLKSGDLIETQKLIMY